MIGLVAQNAAEPILRKRQTHKLEGSERACGADRLHIGGVLVHRPSGAERVGQSPKVVAASGRVGGVQGLLVGAGASRRAAECALARDDHVDVPALQLDRGAQPRRATAKDERFRPVNRQDVRLRLSSIPVDGRSLASLGMTTSVKRSRIDWGTIEVKGRFRELLG